MVEQVLAAVRERGQAAARDVVEITGLERRDVERALGQLVRRGVVTRTVEHEIDVATNWRHRRAYYTAKGGEE